MNIHQLKTKTKQVWEEQPYIVITVVAGIAGTILKTVEVATNERNSRTWEKEVKRRMKN
jgi:hypothetical protein